MGSEKPRQPPKSGEHLKRSPAEVGNRPEVGMGMGMGLDGLGYGTLFIERVEEWVSRLLLFVFDVDVDECRWPQLSAVVFGPGVYTSDHLLLFPVNVFIL